MGRSKIEWLARPGTIPWSWNPVRAKNKENGKVGWYCTKVSPGCRECYSERTNLWRGTGLPYVPGTAHDVHVFLDEKTLTEPLRWKKPRTVFVMSMGDLFHDLVREAWLTQIWAVMEKAAGSTFIVLTKRARRMLEWMRDNAPDPIPNVWGMVTAEDQARADERVPLLLESPFAVRGVSAGPLLGPVDLTCITHDRYFAMVDALTGETSDLCGWPSEVVVPLDWVAAEGESGPRARPMHPAWARSLRDQCAAPGTPFFHKQNGEWVQQDVVPGDDWNRVTWMGEDGVERGPGEADTFWRVGKKAAGRLLDGREWNEWPA